MNETEGYDLAILPSLYELCSKSPQSSHYLVILDLGRRKQLWGKIEAAKD
jgi:hypothetical protein